MKCTENLIYWLPNLTESNIYLEKAPINNWLVIRPSYSYNLLYLYVELNGKTTLISEVVKTDQISIPYQYCNRTLKFILTDKHGKILTFAFLRISDSK